MITLLLPEAFPDRDPDGERLETGEVAVEGQAYRHLFRARRLAPGARIRLVDGLGAARWAEVEEVGRRAARLLPGEPAPGNEPRLALELLVAAPRPQRAGWLVEKATELGVGSIRFLRSSRSPRSYGQATLDRLRRIAVSALEQCHRARLPEISGVHDWEEVAGLLEPLPERWLLDPEGPRLHPSARARAAALVVGPEGGFDDGEREALSNLGCRALGLGSRILRVETATTVGAAFLLLPEA